LQGSTRNNVDKEQSDNQTDTFKGGTLEMKGAPTPILNKYWNNSPFYLSTRRSSLIALTQWDLPTLTHDLELRLAIDWEFHVGMAREI
jgi:hypothetical protein